ncbi:MAG: DUF222 domain-containing protein [Nocardioides sp.]
MTVAPAPPTPPPPDLARLDEADLVSLGVEAQLLTNAHRARSVAVFAEMRDRCAEDHQARRANATQRHFVLTPLEEVEPEFGTLLGLGDHAVEAALQLHDSLRTICPSAWSLCLSGRLDLDRARVITDAARTIARPADVEEYGALMAGYLTKHDDPEAPLVPLTRSQLSRAASYRKLKYEQKPTSERFAEAFAERRVTVDLERAGCGMGRISCGTSCTDAMLADHRLTLIARKRCEYDDEERTLDQMRADSLVDLILGRLHAGALTSELEDDVTADGRDPAATFSEVPLVGGWARPVINVTVPITTLMGLEDEPGLLAGDIAVPPELVRQIATDPGSTWRRLLTDPAGRMVELSTTSYQPTPALDRTVVARDRTCVWPGCCRPSTRCERDHRLPHPLGATCESNLDPLCKRHHKAKHAEGITVRRLADGRYEVRTRRGTVLRSHPSEQPEPRWVARARAGDAGTAA